MKRLIAIVAMLAAAVVAAADVAGAGDQDKKRFAGPVIVEGNEVFGELTIFRIVGLQDGELYGRRELSEAAARLTRAYQKKYYTNAKVSYATTDIGGNEMNVTFIVNEGKCQKVAKYMFEGADHAVEGSVPDSRYKGEYFSVKELTSAIDSSSWWNPAKWFSGNPVTEDSQAECCERVAAVYRDHGYLDVEVSGPERIPVDGDRVNVIFKVNEGKHHHVEVPSVTEVVSAEPKLEPPAPPEESVVEPAKPQPVAEPAPQLLVREPSPALPEMPKGPKVRVAEVNVRAVDGFGGDTSAVLSRCQTKVDAEYSPVMVTRDITSLSDSGEFEEVNADMTRDAAGVAVTFYVKRKMRFAGPVAVVGNDELSESTIVKESGLKDGYLYGESDLAAAAAKVRLAYQKKYYSDAKVTYQTKLIGGNDVNITFLIDEGLQQKVAEYVFEGADHAVDVPMWRGMWSGFKLDDEFFDVSELHAAIDDLPWWNPIGWFSDSPVTRDQQAQCCDKVATVFRNHGYLDVMVTGPERIPSDDGKVKVVFKVVEGVQYRIGTSYVKGTTAYPEEVVFKKSELPEAGTIASEATLNDAAHRVEVVVGSGDSGLADTRVAVQRIPTDDSSVVNIVYKVSEGVPVVIDDVVIRGNDYTKDRVVRREIALGPGDKMLADRAERSQKRLENLDYFSRVRYYLEASDKGKDEHGAEYRNLVYDVEEKNTGSFMVGIGASTVDSVYITAEVNQNNFDLFAPSKLFRGAGQKGRVAVAWGPRYQSAEVGFVEPHLFNRLLELSVDIYRRMRWYDEYDLYRTGARADISYPVKFWPTWEAFGRLGIGLSGEYIQFDEVDNGFYLDDYGRMRQLYVEEERMYDEAFEPVIHLFWLKDNRDNYRIPTRGHRTKLYGDVSPACDNQYWRLGFTHRSYFNVWKRFDHVFMAGVKFETIDAFKDEVPIYNRMFLGGPRSIRGIKYRNVSPMVQRAYSSDYSPWGGQSLFCMNFEYTIPIVKMFRFALFSDLGSVGEDVFDLDFKNTFAWTAGLGLRLDLPMFPIRLDFGVPIVKPDEAEEEIFSFMVGYDF